MPQLALFQSTILVLTTILEIPTGYIADRYSRKLSVALGFLCAGIGYVGYVFVRDIYTLLPLSLVFALSKALNSGAEESLLYDELKEQSTEATFLKVTTKGGLFSTISAAIASFSGPILYSLHYSLPFVLTAITTLGLIPFVLTFKETKSSHEVARQLRLWDGVKNVTRSKPIFLIVCIETLLLVFVVIHYQILFLPKLNQLGLELRYIGIVDVVNIGLVSLLLYLLPRLVFKKAKLNLATYSLTVAWLFVVYSNSTHLTPVLLFGVLFDASWTVRTHILPTITNQYLESHSRALSLSSMSFASNLGSAILLPLATLLFEVNYLFAIVPAILITLLIYVFPKREEGN